MEEAGSITDQMTGKAVDMSDDKYKSKMTSYRFDIYSKSDQLKMYRHMEYLRKMLEDKVTTQKAEQKLYLE